MIKKNIYTIAVHLRQTPLNSKVEIGFLGGEHLLESPLLQEITGEFIDKHKIQNAQISDDLDIRGAMKIPHLHFNDKIYTLSSEQWAKLSDGAIASSKAKYPKGGGYGNY